MSEQRLVIAMDGEEFLGVYQVPRELDLDALAKAFEAQRQAYWEASNAYYRTPNEQRGERPKYVSSYRFLEAHGGVQLELEEWDP